MLFLDGKTLASYIPKRGKNVIQMSMQHHNGEVHDEREGSRE